MSVLSRSWLFEDVRWRNEDRGPDFEARSIAYDLVRAQLHATNWHERQLAIWQEREDERLIAGVAF